jgi:Probable zinc-ribbon domain
MYHDKTLTCVQCGRNCIFAAGEQSFFYDCMGWTNAPSDDTGSNAAYCVRPPASTFPSPEIAHSQPSPSITRPRTA